MCFLATPPSHVIYYENVTLFWVMIQFNLLGMIFIREERTICNRSQHEQGYFHENYLL